MKEEEKKQVYQYLKNYIDQKEKHSNYIDYYELCDLSSNMSIEELQAAIKEKKLVKLFHPDQEGKFEDDLKLVFRECSDKVKDMVHVVFADDNHKIQYDNMLVQEKNSREESSFVYEEKQEENSKEESSFVYEEKQEKPFTIQDENILERAIETTIYKYGFYQGYIALQKSARNDFSYVTKDNSSRELLSQVGSKKIKEIIKSNRLDIMETKSNSIVMDYYCKLISKSGLREKANVFYNACLETAKKYDLKSDRYQTDYAISYYINDLNMDYFTNKNVDKNELCKMPPQDIKILMSAKIHTLGRKNPDYLFSNFSKKSSEEQIRLFAKEIKTEAKNIEQQRKTI